LKKARLEDQDVVDLDVDLDGVGIDQPKLERAPLVAGCFAAAMPAAQLGFRVVVVKCIAELCVEITG
jgi:hypothetical protein